MTKLMYAKLLTCCKGWVKVVLEKSDFKFVCDYHKDCSNTQIWKSHGEYFILREVKLK